MSWELVGYTSGLDKMMETPQKNIHHAYSVGDIQLRRLVWLLVKVVRKDGLIVNDVPYAGQCFFMILKA